MPTPEQWRDRLLEALTKQRTRVRDLRKYYEGEHPLPSPPKALQFDVYREACAAYESLARMGATNFTSLIADAPANRLAVTGFRFGEATGDTDAWGIWQRNHLDADSPLVHSTGLAVGNAYAMVWADENGQAEITVEDPEQTIVAYAPGSRRRRVAALRSWMDDDDVEVAIVYLPDGIYKFQRDADVTAGAIDGGWQRWQSSADRSWPVPNPLGKVPVIEFRANPQLKAAPFGGGRSEFQTVLPIQDRINKTVFDRLVTSEFQAFRQRWVIGWEPPVDADGNADSTGMYRASVSRLQMFWNEDAESNRDIRVGEFGQVDLGPFLKAVEADVQQMAAITETPAYYLLGQMVNISSDALIAAETGLITKTERHRDQFSESWEEVMRLALEVEGDPRADDTSSMVIWSDIEQRTWGQTVDAVLKMKQLGVPTEALWSMLPNVTPQDIARWKTIRATDVLLFGADDEVVDDADDAA